MEDLSEVRLLSIFHEVLRFWDTAIAPSLYGPLDIWILLLNSIQGGAIFCESMSLPQIEFMLDVSCSFLEP